MNAGVPSERSEAPASTERRSPVPPSPGDDTTGPFGLLFVVGLFVFLAVVAGASAVIVVLSLVVMIFLHELGHYLTAKWSGMKVTEFFIGFGPRLWSFRRGETEYGVKAIWAGAYVRIVGMNNLDETDPVDEPRTYRQQSYPKRLLVVSAGSAMHFLIAIVLLVVLYAGFGVADQADWAVEEVAVGSAAEEMGLRAGDEIVELDGVAVETFEDLRVPIAESAGEDVLLVVEREGELVTLAGTVGETAGGVGQLGFVRSQFGSDPVGIFSSVGHALEDFGNIIKESVKALFNFFSPDGIRDFLRQVFHRGGSENVAGSVAGEGTTTTSASDDEGRLLSIYGAARLGTEFTEDSVEGLLGFLVLINIFIGVFNLVPLLPLDGGHIAIATYERIRSLGGRRHHADVAKLLPLTYLVVFVLLSIGVAALYLDIVDPVELR